jgi:hypothetical protein
MTFKPAIWHPVALVLSALNMVGVGLAAGAAEPLHAGIHAAVALAFWTWGERLREGRGKTGELPRLEALEFEVTQLRRELGEAQERLDFTERMLAQGLEARRVDAAR